MRRHLLPIAWILSSIYHCRHIGDKFQLLLERLAAGVNYTLFSEENPNADIYTQYIEIRDSIPFVVAEAEKLGYKLDRMAMSGGSAGHWLAIQYAYRDAEISPLPVKLVFGA